jgi:quercetin 2,3-dioxygenase
MIQLRDRNTRGVTRSGWLDSRHSFSFGGYRDPAHMGFRNLRVINQDVVTPGAGFPTHAHAQMDIVTWVMRGALQHRDSTGAGSTISRGDLQRMSAGPGIEHSEFNASADAPVEFLQIWLIPDENVARPLYQEARVEGAALQDRLFLACARDGAAPVGLASSTHLYVGRPTAGATLRHDLAAGAAAWLQVVEGIVGLNGWELREGDGAAVEDEAALEIAAETDAEVLLFTFPG